MDVVMIDVPWNGFAASKRVADLAESYELNVAPHNYYSHLSTMHSAHLCACVPNVRIMEIDIEDVPWKDELVDHPPVIEKGELVIPTRPGWGLNLNEDVARKHVWEPGRMPGYTNATRARFLAFSTESVPSSHGRTAVPGPNGSESGLRNVCQ